MERRESFLIKNFMESYTKDIPLHINTLNAMIIVFLGAYIIKERYERKTDTSDDFLTYDYWLKVMKSTNFIDIHDLIYDVIFPVVPKELREVMRER